MAQTVPDQVRRVQYIVTVPAQTTFVYPFVIFNESDLNVYSNGLLQALNIDYTVTDVEVQTGGDVIFTVGRTVDDVITIIGNIPFDRVTDFTSGNFSTTLMNDELDRLVVMMQQLETQLNQLIPRYDDTAVVTSQDIDLPVLPAQSGGKIPVWSKNSTGDLIAAELEEGSGFSDLRAELEDNSTPGNSGANIVGYKGLGPISSVASNVREVIDSLQGAHVDDMPLIYSAGDFTKNIRFELDPNIVTAPTSYDFPQQLLFYPGMAMPFLGTGIFVPAGWIEWVNSSIGNAASGATGRANADTEALFSQLWDTHADAQCPVSGGRGASAVVDFAANKTIDLPLIDGRVVGRVGGSFPNLGDTTGAETHTLIVAEMPAHTHDVKVNDGGAGPDQINLPASTATTSNIVDAAVTKGGGGAHNNMQPTVFENWIIKL